MHPFSTKMVHWRFFSCQYQFPFPRKRSIALNNSEVFLKADHSFQEFESHISVPFFFCFFVFLFCLFFFNFFFFLCFCFVLFSGFCLFFVCLCVCIFLLTHYYSALIMLLRGIFVKRIQPVSVSVQAQLKPNFLQAPLSDEASNSVYQWQQMRHHPLVKIYSKSICDQFQSHRAT